MKQKDDYDLNEKIKIDFKGMPYYVMPRYRTHYVENDYERFSLQILKNNLNSKTVFLDIGAHYGSYSLYAAKGAGSKVIAIEPVNENFQLLNQNVKINKLDNLITTHNLAISDENGEAEFNIPWASDSAGFYEHPNAETIRTQKVTIRKGDDLLDKAQVDLIKIDTEGHEISVLQGLQKTLARNPQAKLIIELNPECLKRAGKTVEDLLETIASFDKQIYIVDEDNFSLIRLSDNLHDWKRHVEETGYANLYCVPRAAEHQFLLFVSHSPRLDGAERALVDQVYALRQEDVLSHVVLPESGPLEQLLIENGIGHSVVGSYSFWVKPQPDNDPNTQQHINRMNVTASAAIAVIAKKINPSAVVNNSLVNPWGYAAARSAGLPLMWMIHEYGDIDHAMPFSHGLDVVRRFVVKESELVFCCSDSVKESLLTRDSQQDKKIHVSYNFMDQALIETRSKETIKSPFSSTVVQRKLCIVGTIKEGKGQILAIKAVHALNQQGIKTELLIIGEAVTKEYLGYLKGVVKELELEDQVKFLGTQPNPYPYIHASDALLVCSNNEAFGRTTAEAMIIGTPVVGSNAGGTSEMVTNNVTGLLFKPMDFEDLVLQIKKLGQVNTVKMSHAAKLRIKQLLDTEKNAQRMITLMNSTKADKNAMDYGKLINQEWVDAVNEQAVEVNRSIVQEEERVQTINQLSAENQALRVAVETLNTELGKVLKSRSWKLTKPLRVSNAKRKIKK
jgi:FkbM family methyltransferase